MSNLTPEEENHKNYLCKLYSDCAWEDMLNEYCHEGLKHWHHRDLGMVYEICSEDPCKSLRDLAAKVYNKILNDELGC